MTILTRGRVVLALGLTLLFCGSAHAQALLGAPSDISELTSPSTELSSSSRDARVDTSSNAPADASASSATGAAMLVATPPKTETGVAWGQLFKSSLVFLTIAHAFRYATEDGTRQAFDTPFFPGYFDSVKSLHGWADGDPFMVNYVGHPMQGAVTNFMWEHNDRAYRTIEFGKNKRYWKGKLRGAAFAYVYSLQFEIGPISEASIGHVQGLFPAQGFVDHVITPSVGLGWAIAEDSIDRYVIRLVESHTANPWVRLFVRGGLNPSRSFANVLNGELPWHRDDRPGVFKPYPEAAAVKSFMEQATESKPVNPPPGVAPFEFTATPNYRVYVGSGAKGSCVGGGGTGAIRIAPEWQIVVDLNGCKLLDLPTNLSGDSLSYMVGPRWTPSTTSRWNPHAQFMVGGTKLTQEITYPDEKAAVLASVPPDKRGYPLHHLYSKDWDTAGFAVAAATGVDYKINNALAFRVANLEYSHSWTNDLNGINYQNGVQFSTGLVLRMGTW